MSNLVRKGRVAQRPSRSLLATSGASFVEYVFIVGVVALGAIVGFRQARFRENTVIAREAVQVRTLQTLTAAEWAALESSSSPSLPSQVHLPLVNNGQPTGPGCFAAGTLVATADGLRPIEAIQEGELLWARDEETGAVDLRPVLKRFATPSQPVIEVGVVTEGGEGEVLRPTPGHPFWVTGQGWVRAQQLSVHDGLWSPSGEPLHLALPSNPSLSYETVYNFEVGEYHTYFVGHHGVWVHNGPRTTRGPPAGGGSGPGWCQGILNPPPAGTLAAIQAAGSPQGGSYNQVRSAASKAGPNGTSLGGEVNHIPAWDSQVQAGSTLFTNGQAPTIWMETADHRDLTSTGSSAESVAWRAQQAALIKEGRFLDAVQMDIDEIHELFGSKYDKGIQEMLEYLAAQGIK